MFGDWINNIPQLKEDFLSGEPYPNVVIPNFFEENFANNLLENFPNTNDKNIIKYWNPIEKKYALNNFENHVSFENLFCLLNTDDFIYKIKQITNIPNLEADPYLRGAGIHLHPRGGKLDLHVDYSIHPITKKERRINLIVYMNKDWKSEWGGSIELWTKTIDDKPNECKNKITPSFNTAVIFQTSDDSLHGLPHPITCTEENYRRSIAIYYVSEPRHSASQRMKAVFSPLPNQPTNDNLKRLYEIRGYRTLTEHDLDEFFPDWKTNPIGDGYWNV